MYFERESVMQRMNFFPKGIIFRWRNKTMWILWFGSEHWGRGLAKVTSPIFSGPFTFVTALNVDLNFSIHSRPPVGQEYSYLCFVSAFVW
jgi:hypothetical protein